jgi:serine/threonine protein kinase
MSSPQAPSVTSSTSARPLGRELAGGELPSEVQAILEEGGPVDARALLCRHPELWANKSAVLDLAYEEYCQRQEGGAPPDPDEFCDRFPVFQTSLRHLIQAHRLVEDNAPLLAADEPVCWPTPGDALLGFVLRSELGHGAFARVYLATEPSLGHRRVAVKVALKGAAEAETLGRLQHPNIVPIHSVQEVPHSGLTVICMPYLGRATLCDVLDAVFGRTRQAVRGSSILEAVRDRAPDNGPAAVEHRPDPVLVRGTYTDAVVHIAIQLTDALAYVHARGVCHRDLKPSNVLMTADGRPMLLDFNLSSGQPAGAGRLGGTLPYMAPEQLRAMDLGPEAGSALIDARSDLFALGVILYELLTGAHPFGPVPLKLSARQLHVYVLAQQRQGFRPLRQRNPRVDSVLARTVERCLAPDPNARPQSAAELAANLRGYLSPLQRARRWLARHSWSSLGVLLLMLAAGFLTVRSLPTPEPQSQRHLRAGLQCDQQGQYRQAIDHFDTAVAADPDLGWAFFGRGWARQQLGDIAGAIDDYEKADDRVRDGRVKAALGYSRTLTQQYPEAIARYQQAISLHFATAAVYNDLGFGYLQSRRPQLAEARLSLDRAIRLDRSLQAAWHNRALVDLIRTTLTTEHLPKAGYVDIQTALRLGPGNVELCYDAACLGACLAKQDRDKITSTLDYLQEAIRLGQDPGSVRDNKFFAALRGESRFKTLTARPARRQPLPQVVRLVDPLPADWPLSLLESDSR